MNAENWSTFTLNWVQPLAYLHLDVYLEMIDST